MEHYYLDNGLLENYWNGQRRVASMAKEYTRFFIKEPLRKKILKSGIKVCPCICISRNIGVGALEIAGIIGEMLGLQVMDRQILEKIACSANLSRSSIKTFDERYPGILKELMCQILGERSFGMNDYARHLFYVAFFLAHSESVVFVGRGIHLMLPRNRVFAVRLICERKKRVKRLAKALETDLKDAGQVLDQAEKEQYEFFHRVHGKDIAPASEFDMVMNLDYIKEPQTAALAISELFKSQFHDIVRH